MTKFERIQELFRKIDPFYFVSKRHSGESYDHFSLALILQLNQFDTEFSIRFKMKSIVIRKYQFLFSVGEDPELKERLLGLLENDLRVEKIISSIKEVIEDLAAHEL